MHRLKEIEMKIALTIMWMQSKKERWEKIRLADIGEQIGKTSGQISPHCKWLKHCQIVKHDWKNGWTAGDKAKDYLKHWGVI